MNRKMFFVAILVLVTVVGGSGVSASAPDAGRVYIHKTRGLAQAIPTWEQVNANGFGDPQTGEVTALESFNGYLYAGTYNPIDPAVLIDGAQIFRSSDGVSWTAVTQPGFGISHDIAPSAILDFVVFNNQIYASTGRRNASQLWRSLNGTIWAPMDVTGFSDPDNVDVSVLAVYNGMIYAAVMNRVTGAQIWRSFTGDNNSWMQVAPETPGTAPASITGLAEFNGAFYAAVESESPAQIWQSYSGDFGAWTTIVSDGFGNADTLSTGGMAVFGGYMYVGAGNAVSGALLYRTSDGTTWEQAIAPRFGDPNNGKIDAVYVFQNQLYVTAKNSVTGMEVWRTADGALWEQVNQDGFGDSNNSNTNGSNAMANFMNQLYVGTSNMVDGGELWRMLQQPPDTFTPTATDTPTPTSTNTSTFTPTNTTTNTATNTPTYTPTASVTLTNTATNTPTFTSTASNTPTNTPTATPTFTSTASNTPTRTPTSTSTFTPTATPTNTPTSTPTNTSTPYPNVPGKVTGGGNIDLSKGKATFGFVVHYDWGAANPSGNLTFMDHQAKLSLKASSFTLLYIDRNHARITGYGTVNGVSNVPFILEVYDREGPGAKDIFMLQIPEMHNYSIGGTVSGGNIKVSMTGHGKNKMRVPGRRVPSRSNR